MVRLPYVSHLGEAADGAPVVAVVVSAAAATALVATDDVDAAAVVATDDVDAAAVDVAAARQICKVPSECAFALYCVCV